MNSNNHIHIKINTQNITASGISDVGRLRKENEDAIWLDESGLVMLIADGMGGHERGAEASQSSINVFREFLSPEKIREQLSDITAAAGVSKEIAGLYTIIYRAIGKTAGFLAERNKELNLERYMGTTIVGLVLVSEDNMLWFNIGDSRIYLYRDSKLKQLSTDHSLHEEWKKGGKNGPEPGKNIITRVIGIDQLVQADIEWDKRQKNDLFILCSDGLTDMISDQEIAAILKEEDDIDQIANLLVNAALDAGGKDNTSVIVCRVL